jgi:hypothetical protein
MVIYNFSKMGIASDHSFAALFDLRYFFLDTCREYF